MLSESHAYLFGLLIGTLADLWPKMQEIAKRLDIEKRSWTDKQSIVFDKQFKKLNGLERIAKCQELKIKQSLQDKTNIVFDCCQTEFTDTNEYFGFERNLKE